MDRKIFSKKRIAAEHQRLVLGSFSWLFASLFLYKDNNTTLHKASPVPCARIFVVPCEIEAATRSLVVKARACQAPWLQPAVIPRESQWQQRIYLWKAGISSEIGWWWCFGIRKQRWDHWWCAGEYRMEPAASSGTLLQVLCSLHDS